MQKYKHAIKLLTLCLMLALILGVVPPMPLHAEMAEAVETEVAVEDAAFSHLEFGLRPIATPVAGHFPTSLYRWSMRPGGTDPAIVDHSFGYYVTLVWHPAVTHYFLPDTAYTVEIIMEPATDVWVPDWHTSAPYANMWAAVFGSHVPASFYQIGATLDQVVGLPTQGVASTSATVVGDNLHVSVTFEPTGSAVEDASLIFFDDFSGPTNQFGLTTAFDRAPNNLFRQDMSIWTDDMSFIRDNQLVLQYQLATPEMFFEHRPAWWADWPLLNPAQMTRASNNFVQAGAVRTLTADWLEATFEHAFGYYEARIKFPSLEEKRGTWGAFWLMNRNLTFEAARADATGKSGAEIDIVETIDSHNNSRFNAAVHWGGYVEGASNRTFSQVTNSLPANADRFTDIYDGGFHIFSVEWSPTNYRFFVNGIEIGSLCRAREGHNLGWGALQHQNAQVHEVNQNPNYIKFSVETALWALNAAYGNSGNFPRDLFGEMIIDYVAVWNGPRPDVDLTGAEPAAFGLRAFNNGVINNQSLADGGNIRIWTQLDGVNALVPFAGLAVTATLPTGEDAMQFVSVNRIWNNQDHVNFIDVNMHAPWQRIYLTATLNGQAVELTLVNPRFFGLQAFNNGVINNQSLANNGTIRIWTQLAGVNTPVPDSIVVIATDQDGRDAMEFVRINHMWANPGYVNLIDVNFDALWTRIYFTATVYGQTVELVLINPRPPVAAPEFGLQAFNNGTINNQSLANAGLIRIWTQLDGVSTPVPDSIVVAAIDQDGADAMEFVRVNHMWANPGYVNLVDVNFNAQWQRIYLTVTVLEQTVELTLVNPS